MPHSVRSLNTNLPSRDGSINSSFLSPPEPPQSEKDVPFKPCDSDKTSLSMKKQSCGKDAQGLSRRRGNRRMASNTDVSHISDTAHVDARALSQSRSLPSIAKEAHRNDRSIYEVKLGGANTNKELRSRRWTLPSKSTPTRGLITLQPITKQVKLANNKESPAMITLRRATHSSGKKGRKMSLTFFPEPTFRSQRSGIFSYFASTFVSDKELPNSESSTSSKTKRLLRTGSIGHDGALPTNTMAAAPVRTEVNVETDIALPRAATELSNVRRCSTKYISETSVYEIIWDENDSNSAGTHSSRLSVDNQFAGRRHSLAAEKLEEQLRKSETQSRRESTTSKDRSSDSSLFMNSGRMSRKSFQGMLDASISRLVNEAALQNLPRSRSSKKTSPGMSAVMEDKNAIHQTICADSEQECGHETNVFTPFLLQGMSTNTASNQCQSGKCTTSTGGLSNTSQAYDRTARRLSSLVGSSTHVRRRSAVLHKGYQQMPGNPPQASKCPGMEKGKPKGLDEDGLPLLNPLRWEERNP